MADPNALYSAVISSSATIVAIIGGLVTSNVLNLAARRRDLQEQLDGLETQLAPLRREREATLAEADRLRLEALFQDEIDRIVALDPFPTTAAAARRALAADAISEAAFARRWQELVAEMDAVERVFGPARVDEETPFGAWFERYREALRRDGIAPSWRVEWLARRRYLQKRSLSHGRPPVRPDLADDPGPVAEAKAGKLALLKESLAGQDRAIDQIEGQQRLLRNRLLEVGAPPTHLWRELAILGVLTVLGIVVPLLFMPQDEGDYQEWHKWAVLSGFFVGLVLLFGYVAALTTPRRK